MDYSSIDLSFIRKNTVILTPNHRLASFLIDAYQQQQINSECVSWEKPEIYSLSTWVEKLLEAFSILYANKPQKLLNTIEQQFIFEQIISNSKQGSLLIEVESTARQAVNAWNLLLQWDLPIDNVFELIDSNSDPAVFKTWALEYQKICFYERWIDIYSMLKTLSDNINVFKSSENILPKTCCLIEHQELSPQYIRLFSVLEKEGIEVVSKKLTNKECKDISTISIETQDLEYKFAANWAKQERENNSSLNLGIVVHNLENCRDKIEEAFLECFDEKIYNISAPKAIAYYNVIDFALFLLQLNNNDVININDLHKLLTSSFIVGYEIEIFKRSMFVTLLRNTNENSFKYSYIMQQMSSLSSDNKCKCEMLDEIFAQLVEMSSVLQGKHSCEHWINIFRKILKIWGWPGNANRNHDEQQLLICWELLLQSYQKLDFVLKKHGFFQAYKALKRLAFKTPFLPESGKVKIQVLGVLEAAGLPFDKLLVMGMHNGAWPMKSQPNPFIPINIQRQFNLPRSSPFRELEFARDLTATFCRTSNKQVIFSFSKIIDDISTTASRLISNFKEINFEYNIKQNAHDKICSFEKIIDDQGPEINVNTVAPGGSKALKLQANCPFWAFAELRLRAVPMVKATIGLTPIERGSLIHEVLAKFWQQKKSHNDLMNTPIKSLNDLIVEYVFDELKTLRNKRPLTLTNNYIEIETERMVSLISKWILYEQERAPFFVYKVEQQKLCRIGKLDFKLRIDRIDRLTTGEIIIIDYKTGSVKTNEWFTNRLQDPQLPMYCVSTELSSRCIAFAIIRPELISFKGVAADSDLLLDVKSVQELTENKSNIDWNEQCLIWKEQLEILSNEFQQGIATVSPLSVNTTCRFCELHALCRVSEKSNE